MIKAKCLVAVILALMLSACSFSNRMSNYEARLITSDGIDYKLFNKRGALLQVETPEGIKITSDDRDTSSDIFDKIMTILLLKNIDDD